MWHVAALIRILGLEDQIKPVVEQLKQELEQSSDFANGGANSTD